MNLVVTLVVVALGAARLGGAAPVAPTGDTTVEVPAPQDSASAKSASDTATQGESGAAEAAAEAPQATVETPSVPVSGSSSETSSSEPAEAVQAAVPADGRLHVRRWCGRALGKTNGKKTCLGEATRTKAVAFQPREWTR